MLNKNQIKHLKALAHRLNPLVLIGAAGLSASVEKEIDRALSSHELIKVKLGNRDDGEQQAMTERISGTLGAELIQQIGHTAVFFRRNKKEPKIELPKK